MYTKLSGIFLISTLILFISSNSVFALDNAASIQDKDIVVDINENYLKQIVVREINKNDRSYLFKSLSWVKGLWAVDSYFVSCFRDDTALDKEIPIQSEIVSIPKTYGKWRCGRNDGWYKPGSDPQNFDNTKGFNWTIDLDELMYFNPSNECFQYNQSTGELTQTNNNNRCLYKCGNEANNINSQCKEIYSEFGDKLSNEIDNPPYFDFLKNLMAIRLRLAYLDDSNQEQTAYADVLVRVKMEGNALVIVPLPPNFYKTPYERMVGRNDCKIETCKIDSSAGTISAVDDENCRNEFEYYLNNIGVSTYQKTNFYALRAPISVLGNPSWINWAPIPEYARVDAYYQQASHKFPCMDDLASLDDKLRIDNVMNKLNDMLLGKLFPTELSRGCVCADYIDFSCLHNVTEPTKLLEENKYNYSFNWDIYNGYATPNMLANPRIEIPETVNACDDTAKIYNKDGSIDRYVKTCSVDEPCNDIKYNYPVLFTRINPSYTIQIINDIDKNGTDDYGIPFNVTDEPKSGLHFLRCTTSLLSKRVVW